MNIGPATRYFKWTLPLNDDITRISSDITGYPTHHSSAFSIHGFKPLQIFLAINHYLTHYYYSSQP